MIAAKPPDVAHLMEGHARHDTEARGGHRREELAAVGVLGARPMTTGSHLVRVVSR
jgi:hypothetical protein